MMKKNCHFKFLYFYELFNNYIFTFNTDRLQEITIISLITGKKLKPYYSSLKNNWRVKLKTCYNHYLQINLKHLKDIVINNGKEVFCQLF